MKRKRISLDYSLITDLDFGGINHRDAPKYCDAYIESASVARLGRLTLWIDRMIPSQTRSVDPTTGITVIKSRCVRLRGLLGPVLWRQATETELDALNEDSDFVHSSLQDYLY